MAVVLNTQVTLDPGNQIAHIADWTGLVVENEYVISGTFLQADTRFTFQGFSDIALTRPPLSVPQAQTEVEATISTVPMPAAAMPPAAYPYILNDRLIAANLNHTFNLSPGTAPPFGNGGNSGQFKIWADTSLTPHVLRMCVRPGGAQNGYVASDWADLFTVDPSTGGIKITWVGDIDTPGTGGGYLPLSGGRLTGTLAVGAGTERPSDAADFNIFTGHLATFWVGFNLYNSGNQWRRVVSNPGAIFNFEYPSGGAFTWYTTPTGAPGSIASLTSVMSLSSLGDLVVTRNINSVNIGASGFVSANYVNTGGSNNYVNTAQYRLNGIAAIVGNDADTRTFCDVTGQWTFLTRAVAGENYYANNIHIFVTRSNGAPLATISAGGQTLFTNLYVTGESRINGWFYVGASTTATNPGGTIPGRIYAGDVIVSFRSDDLAFWAPNGGCTIATAFVSNRNGLAFYAQNGSLAIGGQASAGSVATGQINANNIYCNDTTATGQLFSGNSIFAFTSGLSGYTGHGLTRLGDNPIVSLQTDCYLMFQPSTGNAWWSAGQQVWIMGTSCFASLGPVGGHGPYFDLSDIRLKNADSIKPSTMGLAEILKLKPVLFERLSRVLPNNTVLQAKPFSEELGFVAQDVAKVLPHAVSEVELDDGPALTVATTPIVAAMVNALREIDERLKLLEGA